MMYLESFHKVFKYYYLEGRKNKRLGTCITYSCECIDYIIKNNICKHIHICLQTLQTRTKQQNLKYYVSYKILKII